MPPIAQSDVLLDPGMWVTNGSVRSIVVDGDVTYLGGDFTYMGPVTGYGVPIDTASADPVDTYPMVNGLIRAVANDGSGGWYIGGSFTQVGGVACHNLAHILSDGTVDSSWNPNADKIVNVLAVSGSTVYAGGYFSSVGGLTRNHLAAIDTSTGTPTSWDPNADGSVHALAVSGSNVYAGGNFTTLGGGTYTRNRLAAIDASTGTPTSWNPNANDYVYALAVSGSTVYAGGSFTSLKGGTYTRNRLAAIDASTGTPTSWNPNANYTVYALAVSGSNVYAGGDFTTLGGGTYIRNHLAAIATSTGTPTSWNPNANEAVCSLAVYGSAVYAGGNFTSLGGTTYPRNRLAAIDITTGVPTSWDPSVGNRVEAIAVSGSTIYAGGEFSSVGGVTRNHLAAIDTSSGILTSWDPNASSTVNVLAVFGSTVYAGGYFYSVGGLTRNRLAAIDASTGTPTSWNPNANGFVRSLAISGSTVYAGGEFTTLGGGTCTRNYIAAIDAVTGTPTSWDPNANGFVRALAVSGSTVYAGGDFTTMVGGTCTRNRLAAIDASTGTPTSWDPNADDNIHVLAISGSTVFAGGEFTTLGGGTCTRNHIAAIDAVTGTPTSWDPNANGFVRALAVSGSTVYAGGSFTSLGGATYTRFCLAAIDVSTGVPTSWKPVSDSDILSLAVAGTTIYTGGSFSVITKTLRPYFARFAEMPTVTSITPASSARGMVNVTLTGTRFVDGASVFLKKAGEADIVAASVMVVSESQITCSLDLTGATSGDWDVVLTNPDNLSATLPGGFAVPYQVTAAVSGGHGSVSPIVQEVSKDGTAAIDLVPDDGYDIVTITDNGVPQGVSDPYVITGVTSDHQVVATFTLGTASGTVTANGSSMATCEVRIYPAATGTWDYTATTDTNGNYQTPGLPAGAYRLYGYSDAVMNRWYGDAVTYEQAATVIVSAGADTPDIDIDLTPYCSIYGTVTSVTKPGGVSGIYVYAYSANDPDSWLTQTVTGSDGTYRFDQVHPGDYKICFSPPSSQNYAEQWYSDQPDFASAATVTATGGVPTTGIDAVMKVGGAVYGKVTSASQTGGVSGVSVYLHSAGDSSGYLRKATTDSNGNYSFSRVHPAGYKVFFMPSPSMLYLEQWYNGQPDFASAGTVTVSAGATTSGINAYLERSGMIHCAVAGAYQHNVGINGQQVYLYAASAGSPDDWLEQAITADDGSCQFNNLVPGDYKVYFSGDSTHYPEYYNDRSSLELADVVNVPVNTSVSIIAVLDMPCGSISGTVTGSEEGNPGLAGIQVDAFTSSGTYIESAITDSDGYYCFDSLYIGDYTLLFEGDVSHISEYYDDQPSEELADPVSVTEGGNAVADAVLLNAGAISGTVTGAEAGTPALAGVGVRIYDTSTNECIMSVTTDAAGHYAAGPLDIGGYKMHFTTADSSHLSEWYADKSSYETADVVSVSGMTTVDAALTGYGSISGSLSFPMLMGSACTVKAYRASDGALVKSVSASVNSFFGTGSYTITGLLFGEYKIFFDLTSNTNFCDCWYNNKYSLATATPVVVNTFAATTGISSTFSATSAVTGRITDESTGDPVSGCLVEYYFGTPATSNPYKTTTTNANGEYEFTLSTSMGGNLHVCPGDGVHVDEWAQCTGAVGGLLTIDFSLTEGAASLSGFATDDVSGALLLNVKVLAYNPAGQIKGYGKTDAAGAYTIIGLAPDSYKVYFAGNSNHLGEWYNEKTTQALADAVDLSVEYSSAAGINATLAEAYGSISGTVTGSETGSPALPGLSVELYDSAHALVRTTTTDAAGAYGFGGLHAVNYHLRFLGDTIHTGEYYSQRDQPQRGFQCRRDLAQQYGGER